MRESDLVAKVTKSQIPENYLFGQIHVDNMDTDEVDRFTSARDGILEDDPMYAEFNKFFGGVIQGALNDWTSWRKKHGENTHQDTFQSVGDRFFVLGVKKIVGSAHPNPEKHPWVKHLKKFAGKNLRCYVGCFIAENFLRLYINEKDTAVSTFIKKNADDFKKREVAAKKAANIAASTSIRENAFPNKDALNYAESSTMAKEVDKLTDMTNAPDALVKDVKEQKPTRDAVMHTVEITDNAQQQGDTSWTNIVHKILAFMKNDN